MAVKPDNIISFHSDVHDTTVHLVRRSAGKYKAKEPKQDGSHMIYWRGQLAKDWYVTTETGTTLVFFKGQVVWFDAAAFIQTMTICITKK
jgi:hypothetical protein